MAINSFKTKRLLIKYAGVIAGALYGVLMRVIFNIPGNPTRFNWADLFSLTFVWLVPVVIGIIPMLLASKKQLSSTLYRFCTPLSCVLIFFSICFSTRIEDLVCILIIFSPFALIASLSGIAIGAYILKYRERKGIMYSVLFIPLVAGFIEAQFTPPTEVFNIKTSVIINAQPNQIWPHIVRVSDIKGDEYTPGLFNYAGIPKPLFAELDRDTLGAIRTGHFEGGLMFKEVVQEWQKNKKVSFNITVIPSSIRNTVFDKHVLTGNHFDFLDASYEIERINSTQCRLHLNSSYKLNTQMNKYASWWGNSMLSDFQNRLLAVIKKRCE